MFDNLMAIINEKNKCKRRVKNSPIKNAPAVAVVAQAKILEEIQDDDDLINQTYNELVVSHTQKS